MNEQQLEMIWKKRIEWLDQYKGNGSSPVSGFDFSDGIKPELLFQYRNYNDRTIKDFRKLLKEISEGIVPKGFKANHANSRIILDTIESIAEPHIRIDVTIIEEQMYCIIYVAGEGVYSVSWYKSRGRIGSIVNLEYGSPIRLDELTGLLIALGLEENLIEENHV